jgi:hypothetical protein
MPVEQLTYAALADRLKCSPEASRALARRLRLPRQRANDGKTLVAVDLTEVRHRPLPARSPSGHRSDTEQLVAYAAALKAKIIELEDEISQLQIAAGGHRSDFERERERCDRQRQQYDHLLERCDQFMAALLRQAADLMKTKEAAARFEGELAALRSRQWWRRLAG